MSIPVTSWRPVDLDGVGAIEVRRPTLRDSVGADGADVAWWAVCVRRNGVVLTRDDVLDMDVSDAKAIVAEVMKPRPTSAPSSGASSA